MLAEVGATLGFFHGLDYEANFSYGRLLKEEPGTICKGRRDLCQGVCIYVLICVYIYVRIYVYIYMYIDTYLFMYLFISTVGIRRHVYIVYTPTSPARRRSYN